jgi:hypothetical protein
MASPEISSRVAEPESIVGASKAIWRLKEPKFGDRDQAQAPPIMLARGFD